jgi:hypothetical protein
MSSSRPTDPYWPYEPDDGPRASEGLTLDAYLQQLQTAHDLDRDAALRLAWEGPAAWRGAPCRGNDATRESTADGDIPAPPVATDRLLDMTLADAPTTTRPTDAATAPAGE